MLDVNFLAVFIAALTSFMLGGLWYSPKVFGQLWIKETEFKQEQAGHPAKVFGLSFIFSFIAALFFAQLLGKEPTMIKAVHYALVVGIGFVVTSFGINYQFSNKTFKLLLIDGGYHLSQFICFAIVLALFG